MDNIVDFTVAYNRIQYLSFGFLSHVSSLESMDFIGNPWQCACLELVLRWVRANDIAYVNARSNVVDY